MCTPNLPSWSDMKYCFDLDGTLCETPSDADGHNVRYWDSQPLPYMIEQVNKLYDGGDIIIIMTARGRGSGKNWTELTPEQLDRWGVKYHELEPMFHKPTADLFIDDKGINVEEWKKLCHRKEVSLLVHLILSIQDMLECLRKQRLIVII